MSYTLHFKNQAVDPVAKAPIVVPVGAVDSSSTPLALTGKGAANHGNLQQENLLRLLENFADTVEPLNPTLGMTWFDAAAMKLKLCIDTSPVTWKAVGGVHVDTVAPSPAGLGDIWYELTGPASGILYVYTGVGEYPRTATTIGGWAQIFPTVQVMAGRDEYDYILETLSQFIGEAVSFHGNGAIGRSLLDLPNFAALDADLRAKYLSHGADPRVLVTNALDTYITKQTPSTTMFARVDTAGSPTGSNDLLLSGDTGSQVAGSILLNGVLTALPAGTVRQSQNNPSGYIVWDSANELPGSPVYVSAQFIDGIGWQYDNNTTWAPLPATAAKIVIGSTATFGARNPAVMPGAKFAYVWAHGTPMVGVKVEHLKVQPNSNDWDQLLAAMKYALNRVNVPHSVLAEISPVPFVDDGRSAPASLLALPATNVRYPSHRRRANRVSGMASLFQLYTSTVNTLMAALPERFALRGIDGVSPLAPTTLTSFVHASTTQVMPSGSGSIRLTMNFTDSDEMYRWFCSGQGVQLEVTHVGGANTADTDFRALLQQAGVQRITADRTYIFGEPLPLVLTNVEPVGIWNSHAGAEVLSAETLGPCTLTVSIQRMSDSSFDLEVLVAAGSALAGNTTFTFKLIEDTETI